MRNEIYERLLEKCGPIIRGGRRIVAATSDGEGPPRSNYSKPSVKGILKKTPLVVKLKFGGGEDLNTGGQQADQEEERAGKKARLLQCDLCNLSFPLTMALKQHVRYRTIYSIIIILLFSWRSQCHFLLFMIIFCAFWVSEMYRYSYYGWGFSAFWICIFYIRIRIWIQHEISKRIQIQAPQKPD
jgi:hypothetical protein